MVFSNPYYFILLTVLIPYIIWYVMRSKKSRATLKMPEASKYKALPKSLRQYLIHVPFLLRIILITLVVCILARPQSKHSWSDTDVEGIDIMLAVDVSTSMLAQDFKPNRVEALREIAQHFIEKRMNDNIGLTFFAGEAYTQCPLTTDHVTLLNQLNELECGMINDGTAIGMGLALAVGRLKDSKAISKVIVLLTDGDNNSGDIDPITAAELAAKFGIRVYTIGVGRKGEVPYPTPYGTQMVQNSFNEAPLMKIAKMTNGQYFRATNKNELTKIYNTIDSLEKTKIEDYKFTQKKEEFMPFALLAILMLALEFILSHTICKRFP